MDDKTRFNQDRWIEIYEKTNFGNRYPSSYLVSVYHRIIKEHLPKTKERARVLDFGCSFGANSSMLLDCGLDVYGVDISEEAIKYCTEKKGFDSEKFIACDILSDECKLKDVYSEKFDLIIASEILYYFSSADLDRILHLFNKFLKRDGVIYANMPGYSYAYLQNGANPPDFRGGGKYDKGRKLRRSIGTLICKIS